MLDSYAGWILWLEGTAAWIIIVKEKSYRETTTRDRCVSSGLSLKRISRPGTMLSPPGEHAEHSGKRQPGLDYIGAEFFHILPKGQEGSALACDLYWKARIHRTIPYTIANAPSSHTTANIARKGCRMKIAPTIIARIPPRTSGQCRPRPPGSVMAAMNSKRPITMAQMPMKVKSTGADLAGQKKTSRPRMTPAMPLISGSHQCEEASRSRRDPTTVIIPLTSAYAPKR